MKLDDVTKNYDKASKWYDLLTRLIFHGLLGLGMLRKECLDYPDEMQGASVLDLGCGTGLHFSSIQSRIGPAGRLVAVDYSKGMLSRAQRRVHRKGWKNVELVRDDAASLNRVQEKFDVIVSFWCLGIVYDLEAALENCLARLKPGGCLLVVDFQRSRPDKGLLRWLYPLYRRLLIWARIDQPEDLDNERLQEKWRRGEHYLRTRLAELQKSDYLWGTGIKLYGRSFR